MKVGEIDEQRFPEVPNGELVESDLSPGTELVTSVTGEATATAPAATNPLVATPRGGRGR